ncbi:hypothetical protein LINPERHAP2_LOCUS36843 [Linum perenne]
MSLVIVSRPSPLIWVLVRLLERK